MILLLYMAALRNRRLSLLGMFACLLVEIVLLNLLIAFNGAASNPFSAVLLIPLIMACVWLPHAGAVAIVGLSIAAQWTQWQFTHMDTSHALLAHAQGMLVSFTITSVLIMTVVFYLRHRLAQQEEKLHALREKQLRNEQLLAIGTAAAQLTHELATPTQAAQWLLEEGVEKTQPTPAWLSELSAQLSHITHKLTQWRQVTDDVRHQRTVAVNARELASEIQHLMQLVRPEVAINWHIEAQLDTLKVNADRTLLPALSNVIVNACDAQKRVNDEPVSVSCSHKNNTVFIEIRNAGHTENLEQLGQRLLPSSKGHGAGAIISNATLEKFGGTLRWEHVNHEVITWITLPSSS